MKRVILILVIFAMYAACISTDKAYNRSGCLIGISAPFSHRMHYLDHNE
jgi:hypothetical protein